MRDTTFRQMIRRRLQPENDERLRRTLMVMEGISAKEAAKCKNSPISKDTAESK
jgi:hypothetical protein